MVIQFIKICVEILYGKLPNTITLSFVVFSMLNVNISLFITLILFLNFSFNKAARLVNKKGILEVEVLKGQESFRIKPFTKANAWALFESGKSAFKKGKLIECFIP